MESFWYYSVIGIVLVVVLCGLLATAMSEDEPPDLPTSSLDT